MFFIDGKMAPADFIDMVDAESRQTIWAINHMDTPRIAALGLFSQTGDGCIAGDGFLRIFLNGGFFVNRHIDTPYGITDHYEMIPLRDIKAFLAGEGLVGDPVYFCREKGLSSLDMDKVSGKLQRCFMEDRIIFPPMNDFLLLPAYNSNGHLQEMKVLFRGGIFALKTFKYIDSPENTVFLFRPEKPGLCFLHGKVEGKPLIVSPDYFLAEGNPEITFLHNCGNLADLDWELFRGNDPVLIRKVLLNNEMQNHNILEETMKILAEGKRHHVNFEVQELKQQQDCKTGVYLMPNVLADPYTVTLDNLLKEADRLKIQIDPILEENAWLIPSAEQNTVTDLIPGFGERHGTTAVYGPGSEAFLTRFSIGSDYKKVLAIVPHGYENRMKKHLRSFNGIASMKDFSDLRTAEDHLTEFHPATVVILRCDEIKTEELASLIDLLQTLKIPARLGFKNEPLESLKELNLNLFYAVGKEDRFFLKEIRPEGMEEIIKEITFSFECEADSRPATEEELNNMENER